MLGILVILGFPVLLLSSNATAIRMDTHNCSQTFQDLSTGQFKADFFSRGYDYFLMCNFEIKMGSNKLVQLKFEQTGYLTPFDYVVVFAGEDCLAKREYFVANSETPSLTLDSSSATILFLSQGFWGSNMTGKLTEGTTVTSPTSPNGFAASILDNCGEDLTSSSGQLSASQYIKPKRHNILCIWRIKTMVGEKIRLNVQKLKQDGGTHGVWVLDGPNCGSEILFQATDISVDPLGVAESTGNVLTVVYMGVEDLNGQPFEAHYETASSASDSSTESSTAGPTTASSASDSSTESPTAGPTTDAITTPGDMTQKSTEPTTTKSKDMAVGLESFWVILLSSAFVTANGLNLF